MASRPVFFPIKSGAPGVHVENVEFKWVAGMAASQRRKCVVSLHSIVREKCPNDTVLEVSSKSDCPLGVRLSAFNLGINSSRSHGFVCVESVYQCSKVFRHGGPFPHGYRLPAREARVLVGRFGGEALEAFDLHGERWPLNPCRAFYNWVYCQSLARNPHLAEALAHYTCFSDIEFNPSRSVNCQAYAVALYLSLQLCGVLKETLSSKEAFLSVHSATNEEQKQEPRPAPAVRPKKTAPASRRKRPATLPASAPMTLFEQAMPGEFSP